MSKAIPYSKKQYPKKETQSAPRRSYHGSYPAPSREDNPYYCYFNPLLSRDQLAYSEQTSYLAPPAPTDFKYFSKALVLDPQNLLPKDQSTIDALTALGELLVDQAPAVGNNNANMPPGYTYWGQFIDHDLTAGTDRSHGFTIAQPSFTPIHPDDVEQDIQNQRTPFFDLDSVFGDANGPFGSSSPFYGYNGDPVKLKIGTVTTPSPGETPQPQLGLERDLPRNAGKVVFPDELEAAAAIGDMRNDENLIIAQFHLGIMKFYNSVVDAIRQAEPTLLPLQLYFKARREVTFHYQWLVVNDFLQRICDPAVVTDYLNRDSIFGNNEAFMPLEFSTAVYRFGHSMVRNAYDYNRNFGDPGLVLPEAGFELIFQFTGKGGGADPALPDNWIIEWDRFFSDPPLANTHFARKIDTRLAADLTVDRMQNEFAAVSFTPDEIAALPVTESQFNAIMTHLAIRNLRRGYLLSMPTGQALASEFGLTPLTPNEITQDNSEDVNTLLEASGFDEKTPLWYYILKEAELHADGNRLGELGSHVVASTFVGLLKSDLASYLNVEDGWSPATAELANINDGPIDTIMKLLQFAKVA